MCRVIGLASVFAVAVTAVGAADQPPGLVPGPGRARQTFFDGTVVAVEPDAVTIRGFDAVLSFGAKRTETTESADGRKWTTEGEHTARLDTRGPLGPLPLPLVRSVRTRERWTLFPADGGDRVVLDMADQPARRFPARGPLAEGGYKGTGANSYRLADLAVGDWVSVKGTGWGVAEFAETVSIRRRPGGRVPPAPDNVANPPPLNQPWFHEMMNARQDWEDKGIPLPQGYREFKRWIHPAPEPRPASPKAS